jgi:hypothetical protein
MPFKQCCGAGTARILIILIEQEPRRKATLLQVRIRLTAGILNSNKWRHLDSFI